LYYCSFFRFSLSGLRFTSRFLIPDSRPHPHGRAACLSCAGLKLSKIVAAHAPLFQAHLPSFAGCKNTTFYFLRNGFFQLFFIKHLISLIHNEKKFYPTAKKRPIMTHYYINKKNGGPTGPPFLTENCFYSFLATSFSV